MVARTSLQVTAQMVPALLEVNPSLCHSEAMHVITFCIINLIHYNITT